MNPEDFSKQRNDHPEVLANPELMQPPEQETIADLVFAIMQKTDHKDYLPNGEKGADLHRVNETMGAATVYLKKKGTDRNDPKRIAQVHLRKRVGSTGSTVITNYFVLSIPDGLHIEKHSQMSNNDNILREGASMEEIRLSAQQGIEMIQKTIASDREEDELGLSFVSEAETRGLVTLLEGLEPYSR